MSDTPTIVKAELQEIVSGEVSEEHRVTVQFNPETLKVSYSNQVVPPAQSSGTDQRGTTATQFVGRGATKLTVQLWFDATAVQPQGKNVKDVRELTKEVAYFITPQPADDDPEKQVPPAVRFEWGTFRFDGIMESLEESLEFFSPEGRPLRASCSLSLSQQRIEFAFAPDRGSAGGAGRGGAATPGTRPLTQAAAGATLQQLADSSGRGDSWQRIAEANGIENPRQLEVGALLDLGAGVRRQAGRNT